ncbi:hypothetical protein [Neorhodopirellula lusitana]|uniref:hypothetical protein n=1 Tax=Neorhodopirellula lusitana TaxID=445327 RepID=UPI0038509ADD
MAVSSDILDRPLNVVTTGTDLITSRRLVEWQSQGKIALSIESDPSTEAMRETASRDGMISATLAEVATHGDFIWLVGDVEQTYPRIAEKLRLNSAPQPRVIRHSQLSAEQLANIAASPGDLWQDSKYACLLVGPAAFKEGEETITATMATRLIRSRNKAARAVAVTLDAAATLRAVSLWTSNTSPSESNRTRIDIRIGSALSKASRPATIQIGGQDPGPKQATAYLATSIPGLHHTSMTLRGDGSVSLPLSGHCRTNLQPLTSTIQKVLSR